MSEDKPVGPLDHATELVHLIGERLMDEPENNREDWEAVAMISRIEPAMSGMDGFLYLRDGSYMPASVGDRTLFRLFKQFHQATDLEGNRRWKTMVFQLVRDTGKIHIEMEWDDIRRWAVTPQNIKSMADQLRPSSGQSSETNAPRS